jgi:3'-phosphoadenosine 5'-phosphosulfate sulfotransferase (PAPS reductase)/FAD synthetase
MSHQPRPTSRLYATNAWSSLWLPNGASADAVVKASDDTQPKKRLSSVLWRLACGAFLNGDCVMNVVGLSGGKDSTALAFMLKEREPNTDWTYICTPTGDESPEMVYITG